MGTLHQIQNSNNKSSRIRGRPAKIVDDTVGRENGPSKRRLIDPVLGSYSRLFSKSLEIINTHSQAVSFYQIGEFQMASSLFEKAAQLRDLSVRENETVVAGGERRIHLDNPASRDSGIAPPTSSYIYQRLDFDEGMNVYNDPEPIRFEDHPVAVEAALLFNLGQARRSLEDFESANVYYRKALRVLLPVDESCDVQAILADVSNCSVHRVIIPILHNLGLFAYRKGSIREALAFYNLALRHSHLLNGPIHLSVGATFNCLGVLSYHLSSEHSEQALSYFREALEIQCCLLGNHSAAVATTLNNLGRVMVQRENFVAAYGYYERALAIRRKVLGVDNLDYAATAFNAGQSLHQQGKHDQALILYQEFLRVALTKFSERSHRDVAVVLSGIAQIYQERKEHGRALELYKESLRVGRAALGKYHSEVAMLLNRIGNFYFEREDFDAALKAYKDGLSIERKVLEKSHPNIIVTLSNIGEIYRQQGKYGRAIAYYKNAMDLQKLRHGESSAEVAATLNVIGLVHDQAGQSSRALKVLQEALVMRRSVLGDDHLDVAATLTYLGTIFYRRSMISAALQLFTESLRIRKEKLGRNDRDVSFTLYNVGLCHLLQGENKSAISCFEETLQIETDLLGRKHKDVALTLFKLGEAHKADGDLDAALMCFKKALEIERKVIGKDDPATVARTLNEIGNVFLAKGNVSEMMVHFIESARVFRSAGLAAHAVNVSPALKLHAAGMSSAAASA